MGENYSLTPITPKEWTLPSNVDSSLPLRGGVDKLLQTGATSTCDLFIADAHGSLSAISVEFQNSSYDYVGYKV